MNQEEMVEKIAAAFKCHLRSELATQGRTLQDLDREIEKSAMEKEAAVPRGGDSGSILPLLGGGAKMYGGSAFLAGALGAAGTYAGLKGIQHSRDKTKQREELLRELLLAQKDLKQYQESQNLYR